MPIVRSRLIVTLPFMLPLLAFVAFLLWSRPRASVPLPNAQTSPASVVRAYVRALDARDYATSNALQPSGVGTTHWWTLQGPTVTHLRITSIGPVVPGAQAASDLASSWSQSVEVDTEADFANWSGMIDGRQPWSYYLVRNTNAQHWRIIDWGQG